MPAISTSSDSSKLSSMLAECPNAPLFTSSANPSRKPRIVRIRYEILAKGEITQLEYNNEMAKRTTAETE